MVPGAPDGCIAFPTVEFSLAEGRLLASATAGSAAAAGASGHHSAGNFSLNEVGALLVLASATARRLEAQLPSSLEKRDRAVRRYGRALRFPLSLALPWRPAALQRISLTAEEELQAKVSQRNSCCVRTSFMFGDRADAAYLRLASAFERLTKAHSVWEVASFPVKASPTAAAELQRSRAQIAPTLNEFLDAGLPGFGFGAAGGSAFELYPAFLIARGPDGPHLVSALEAKLTSAEAAVAETGSVPPDAARKGSTWERTNKDGSPDRRVASNRSIPILRYGLLTWSIPGRAARSYLVSSIDAAHAFAAAFADYQSVLIAEANREPGAASRQKLGESTVVLGLEPVISTAPPPPRVSPAHEYTVAAAAGALGLWLALAPPTPPGNAGTGLPAASTLASTAPASAPAALQATAPEPALLPPPAAPARPAEVASRVPEVTVATTPHAAMAEPARSSAPAAGDAAKEQIRTRTGANVRSAPNGSADVVRTVAGGTRLDVFGRSGGWVRIGDGEAWGWIHSSLLEAAN
jgi:hypothetical protein